MCIYVEIVLARSSIMSNAVEGIDTREEEVIWSTWEELLLAFAVKRYGLKDWDTVATELQNRRQQRGSSFPPGSYTAQICKDKYRNLKRRFTNHRRGGGVGSENNDESDDDDDTDARSGGGGGGGGADDAFPWLEELRKLRVAELKQEVHRYDVSIRSLQIKVKTMEEERESSLREDQNDKKKQQQPDLDDEVVQRERSENDNKSNDSHQEMAPEHVGGKSVSGSAGDDENMSFNESNSAGNREAFLKIEPESEPEPAEVKPDPDVKPAGMGREDSCNDSSDRHEVKKKKNEEDGRGESEGLRDSVGESKEGTKESSDVQSSASLLTSQRKRRKVEGEGEGEDGGGNGSTAPIKRESEGGAVKSEAPAVSTLLDKIRAHKRGSVFERRLQSQRTEKYKKAIRRHVDLETIQARIDDGSYSSCPNKFYVDLLLLFNNAIVFFPKASAESRAAQDLRELVMKELKNNPCHPPPPIKLEQPMPEPERPDSSLLARNKSTNPIVVCRKRSSISAKASSSPANKAEKHKDSSEKPATNSKPLVKSPPLTTSNEEEDSVKLKAKEKPVTGARSARRSTKGRTNVNKTESTPNSSNSKSLSSQQQHSVKDKVEAGSKGDKKKSETAATVKKSGAADFLKRMKKNSPAKGTLVEASKSSKDNTRGGKKDQKKKVDARKDGPVRRSAAAGGRKQTQTKEESSPSTKRATTGRPTRKGKEVAVAGRKRGRDGGGEVEGSSQRARH